MFNEEDYFIFGGSFDNIKNIWNKNGKSIGNIEKSEIIEDIFIESTYIDNKPYILLSGVRHSECYDYNNTIKIYKSYNKNNTHYIANLFRNNNQIFFLPMKFFRFLIVVDSFLFVQQMKNIF